MLRIWASVFPRMEKIGILPLWEAIRIQRIHNEKSLMGTVIWTIDVSDDDG